MTAGQSRTRESGANGSSTRRGESGRRRVDGRWVFGLGYFLLLLAFPVIYMRMRGEFYFAQHSIARDVSVAERAIAQALRDTLVTGGREYVGSIETTNWMVWRKGVEFSAVEPREDGSVHLTFNVPAFFRIQGHRVASSLNVGIVIDAVSGEIPSFPGMAAESAAVFQWARFERPQPAWVQTAVWDSLLWCSPQPDGNTAGLNLTLSQVRQLRALVDAVKGDPAAIRGSYLRMLYMSASTITTVGFGDVVPVSTRARLLVGSEAVAGVVCAGLFVNALFRTTEERVRRAVRQGRRKQGPRPHVGS